MQLFASIRAFSGRKSVSFEWARTAAPKGFVVKSFVPPPISTAAPDHAAPRPGRMRTRVHDVTASASPAEPLTLTRGSAAGAARPRTRTGSDPPSRLRNLPVPLLITFYPASAGVSRTYRALPDDSVSAPPASARLPNVARSGRHPRRKRQVCIEEPMRSSHKGSRRCLCRREKCRPGGTWQHTKSESSIHLSN
jgi:hypothetical protein